MKGKSKKVNPIRKINWFLMKKFNFGIKRDYPFRTSAIFAKNYFKRKEGLVAIEVGVHKGESAEYLLKKIPSIERMYLIDPYNVVFEGESGLFRLSATKKRLGKFAPKCIFIKKTSDEALKELKKNKVRADFIYLDGDHSYIQVKKDLENYFSLLKKEGILSGNDIKRMDVSRALFEFCCEKKQIPLIKEMDWMFVRKC
jgi:hypothetical protein